MIPTLGLATLVGAGVLGVSAVSADDNSYPPFIQGLAERFGLNQDEVETFFNEQMQLRHHQMMQSKENGLSKAVEDGVITEEQKQKLVIRWEEMRAQREQRMEENRVWLEENGINPEALQTYIGFGHRGLNHGPWHIQAN